MASNFIKESKTSKTASSNISRLDEQPSLIGRSESCDIPPKTLNWNGQIYTLSHSEEYPEPTIKLGYMQCINGDFISAIDDGGENHFIIYLNGVDDYELMIFGKWGKALYSPKSE
ncbi:hypothetical protein P5G65_36375 [Paenibacillus chondroitinus]|uniref:Uncharacterized protein n=1 Tax=Paenibacillus chondroitinus TaxID=59842 RepID=A0ABU6DPV7_9BACL|nr:hypothetical protein [Paenibacillus chondroitinus]MEB4799342.1 hypothetical protein [Paenibacillus chondroitinus]